jgi:hypothetical protein
MIQPFEMTATRPIKLHDGGVSTTTNVWSMLTASRDVDLDRLKALVQIRVANREGFSELSCNGLKRI